MQSIIKNTRLAYLFRIGIKLLAALVIGVSIWGVPPVPQVEAVGEACFVNVKTPWSTSAQQTQGTRDANGDCVVYGVAVKGDSVLNVGETDTKDDIGCLTRGLRPSICISNLVYIFTVGLGSALAYVGAYFFDTAVSLALNSAAYALQFISTGWTVARDLANMGFILALVYLAYTIMLKAETSNTMQMLAWIIFIALIINFSFFFTRLVIDAGNILAVQFYNAIQAPPLSQTLQNTAAGTTMEAVNAGTLQQTKDLTHSIMAGLNMQGLFNTTSFNQWFNQSGFLTAAITLSFLYITVGAMYFLLAVMFLTAGVKFLVRIVVLWFLIIASPLAFLAKTTTLSTHLYDKWQGLLIRNTFYPVVFLFIFLFISLFMANLNSQGGIIGGLFTDLSRVAAGSDAGVMYLAANIANVAIRMGFVIAMLYIGMKLADTIGVYGASAAKSITSFVARGAFGTAAFAGKVGIGGVIGGTIARQQGLARGGLLARGLWNTGRFLNTRTYDVRNVPGVKKSLGILAPNIDVGVGTTKTARDLEKQVESFGDWMRERSEGSIKDRKELEDRLETIEAQKNAKRAATTTVYDDLDKELEQTAGDIKKRDELAQKMGPLNRRDMEEYKRLTGVNLDAKKINLESEKFRIEGREKKTWDQLMSEHKVLSERAKNMSNAQVVSLKVSDIEGIIKQISESHLKAIKESGKYTSNALETLTNKWHQENKKAPIGKATEEINKLEKLHAELGDLGIQVKSIKERGLMPNGDTTITLKAAKDTKEALEEEKRKQEEAKEKTPTGQARSDIQIRINQLTKAIKRAESAVESLEKVPEKVGGREAPGEFIIKK